MNALKMVAGLVVALAAYLLFWPTGMHPVAWTPPQAPALEGPYAANARLADAQRIAVGVGRGPEAVSVDALGRVYAGFDDGRVVQFSPNGSVYVVVGRTGGRPLGIAQAPNGGLIVADARQGLLHLGEQITTLAREADGVPFGFTDDVDTSRASMKAYFTDASSHYGYGHHTEDLLEHGANGRLLEYDFNTRQVRTVLGGLHFANGVALGPNDDYVLVNETGEYRVVRYWLKGEKAGTHETFIDNLPGFPDNITFNGKDRFWLALAAPRDAMLDKLLPGNFLLRQVSFRLPAFAQPQPHHKGFVLALDLEGHVVANLQDDRPEAFAPITSVREAGPWLYFGSLTADSLARLPVQSVFPDAAPPPVNWHDLPPLQERPRERSWEGQREDLEEKLKVRQPAEREEDEERKSGRN